MLSLQQASRHVNEMAANVVASTKTGQEQIEEKGVHVYVSVCEQVQIMQCSIATVIR